MSRTAFALAAAAVLTACSPSPETAAPAETPPPAAPAPAPAAAPDLKTFLTARTADAIAPLRYVSGEWSDANTRLVLVQFLGPEYCGSGGCNLLILRPEGDSFTVLGDVTITRAPVRVLASRTNGLPDIAVQVSGGGADPHEALLPFDGARYASNPTVAPARPTGGAPGVIVIAEDQESTELKPAP